LIGELIANAICGGILLAVLMLAGFVSDRWMERHVTFDHPIWRMPLEDWSR
jgi:hypothetical protein